MDSWMLGRYWRNRIILYKEEAEAYFKRLRSGLNSSKYIITKDSMVDKENPDNEIYITHLKEIK